MDSIWVKSIEPATENNSNIVPHIFAINFLSFSLMQAILK